MPGNPKECRERAARCLELAASAANDGIKQMFLNIARHWEALAMELERAKEILNDEKGGVTVGRHRRHRRAAPKKSKRTARRKKKTGGAKSGSVLRSKRVN